MRGQRACIVCANASVFQGSKYDSNEISALRMQHVGVLEYNHVHLFSALFRSKQNDLDDILLKGITLEILKVYNLNLLSNIKVIKVHIYDNDC